MDSFKSRTSARSPLDCLHLLAAWAGLFTGIDLGLATQRPSDSAPTPSFGASALQAL
ncbi:hypothetical protein ACX80Z_15365 [Arthrobacter sp. TMT4-20]